MTPRLPQPLARAHPCASVLASREEAPSAGRLAGRSASPSRIEPPMNDMTAAGFSRVPFQITDPERIPAQRYYDAEFFELERQRLWPHVWQMACRLEEIPEVGDWVEYKNLDKSVIIVRTKSGIKAFHNACRHRGVQLASG